MARAVLFPHRSARGLTRQSSVGGRSDRVRGMQRKRVAMTKWTRVAVMSMLLTVAAALDAAAQAPPAPVLVAPGNGAALAQPITLDWGAVVDPDGPIGSY